MRRFKTYARQALFAGICLAMGGQALAQEAQVIKAPVKVIVPFSPGALIDILARIYAPRLSERIGQPVVVENRPGAGGMVGTQRLLAEPPDKNTMLFVSSSYAVNPSVHKSMPFDTLKDLSGVASIAHTPTLVIVNSARPVNTLRELIESAKQPGAHFNYGSAGVNSATDLVGRYFNQEAGIHLEHIPYKGVQEAAAEVAAGRIDVSFPSIATALPFIKAGQVKPLAVTSPKRSALLPDTPTADEQGVAGFDYSIWYGVIMSAKTEQPVKEYLAKQIAQINQDSEVVKQLESQGLVSQTILLGEFDQYIEKEIGKFGKILKSNQ